MKVQYSPVQVHVTGSIVEVEVWWSLESEKWRVVNGQRWRCKMWKLAGSEVLIEPAVPCAKTRQCLNRFVCKTTRFIAGWIHRTGSHTKLLKSRTCQNLANVITIIILDTKFMLYTKLFLFHYKCHCNVLCDICWKTRNFTNTDWTDLQVCLYIVYPILLSRF